MNDLILQKQAVEDKIGDILENLSKYSHEFLHKFGPNKNTLEQKLAEYKNSILNDATCPGYFLASKRDAQFIQEAFQTLYGEKIKLSKVFTYAHFLRRCDALERDKNSLLELCDLLDERQEIEKKIQALDCK